MAPSAAAGRRKVEAVRRREAQRSTRGGVVGLVQLAWRPRRCPSRAIARERPGRRRRVERVGWQLAQPRRESLGSARVLRLNRRVRERWPQQPFRAPAAATCSVALASRYAAVRAGGHLRRRRRPEPERARSTNSAAPGGGGQRHVAASGDRLLRAASAASAQPSARAWKRSSLARSNSERRAAPAAAPRHRPARRSAAPSAPAPPPAEGAPARDHRFLPRARRRPGGRGRRSRLADPRTERGSTRRRLRRSRPRHLPNVSRPPATCATASGASARARPASAPASDPSRQQERAAAAAAPPPAAPEAPSGWRRPRGAARPSRPPATCATSSFSRAPPSPASSRSNATYSAAAALHGRRSAGLAAGRHWWRPPSATRRPRATRSVDAEPTHAACTRAPPRTKACPTLPGAHRDVVRPTQPAPTPAPTASATIAEGRAPSLAIDQVADFIAAEAAA